MDSFASRFKQLREKRGWTQEEAAEKIGVSRPTIAGYESEEKNRIPREETLHRIADLFNVSTDYLLGRTDDKNERVYKDAETTIHLIKEAAAKYGYKVDDPEFLKILSKAFDIIEVTHRDKGN